MCDANGHHLHYLRILTGEDEETEWISFEPTDPESMWGAVEQVLDKAREDARMLPPGHWAFCVEQMLTVFEAVMRIVWGSLGHEVDDGDMHVLQNMPLSVMGTVEKFSRNAMSRDFALPSLVN